MRKCPNCGFVITNDAAKFCKRCGTNVEQAQFVKENELAEDCGNVDKPKVDNHLTTGNEETIIKPSNVPPILSDKDVKVPKSNSRVWSKKTKKWLIISLIIVLISIVLWLCYVALSDVALQSGQEDVVSTQDSVVVVDEDMSSKTSLQKIQEVKKAVEIGQHDLPLKCDNGIVLIKMEFDDENVIYSYECDEDIVSVCNMDAANTKENLLEYFKENTEDFNIRSFMKLCKRANVGVKYIYIGNVSGSECVVTISPSEIPERED